MLNLQLGQVILLGILIPNRIWVFWSPKDVPVVDVEQVADRPGCVFFAGVFRFVCVRFGGLSLGGRGLSFPCAEVLVVVGDTTGAIRTPSWAFLLPVSMGLGPPTVGAGLLGVSLVLLVGGLQG